MNQLLDLESFRDIVKLLIQNSLLLSLDEKAEFIQTLPALELEDVRELFTLLVGAKKNIDEILDTLARDYPEVHKNLDEFQMNALKKIYKAQRKALLM